jgi:hypothetical protein
LKRLFSIPSPVNGLVATVVLVAALAAPACGTDPTGPTSPTGPGGPSGPAAVTAYLEEMVRTMQAESANSRAIDWARFRADVLAAGAPQTVQEAYPAIELALRSLNDFESHYVSRTGRLLGPSPEPSCTSSPATTSSLPETIGYVKVNGCPCEGPAANEYAETLQKAIRMADRPGLIGWIVDLREDGGGNMWPMMAGLGPILGEGIMGWIVYNNREYEREYRGGAALSLGDAFARVASPYTLLEPAPRVAVLTGGGTNSAGEAIVVWFKGRPDTRSFGTPTCGHHHLLVGPFRLTDGGLLTLKNANNADRLKRPYAGPVAPDETIAEPAEAISRAVRWLETGR